jgi:SAM-dependent methyltransferase
MSWDADQEWERQWWGECLNTYFEEEKQFTYARLMGIPLVHDGKSGYEFNINGYILDIGGGPTSMLLKAPRAKGVVVDPCEYPLWVYSRYTSAGIVWRKEKGEDIDKTGLKDFDLTLIYNCLQHVENPEKIIKNAFSISKEIRIFEWLETGVAKGHPQNLTEKDLNDWLGGVGKTENINEGQCHGLCYYGIFKGKLFEGVG